MSNASALSAPTVHGLGYLSLTDTITMIGSGGQRIVIHTDTGEVDLCGLDPSAAARLFWDAVRAWPRPEVGQ